MKLKKSKKFLNAIIGLSSVSVITTIVLSSLGISIVNHTNNSNINNQVSKINELNQQDLYQSKAISYISNSHYEIDNNYKSVDFGSTNFNKQNIDIDPSGRRQVATKQGWVLSTNNEIFLVDSNTGQVKWSTSVGQTFNTICNIAYNPNNDTLLVVHGSATPNYDNKRQTFRYFLTIFNATNGSIINSNPLGGAVSSNRDLWKEVPFSSYSSYLQTSIFIPVLTIRNGTLDINWNKWVFIPGGFYASSDKYDDNTNGDGKNMRFVSIMGDTISTSTLKYNEKDYSFSSILSACVIEYPAKNTWFMATISSYKMPIKYKDWNNLVRFTFSIENSEIKSRGGIDNLNPKRYNVANLSCYQQSPFLIPSISGSNSPTIGFAAIVSMFMNDLMIMTASYATYNSSLAEGYYFAIDRNEVNQIKSNYLNGLWNQTSAFYDRGGNLKYMSWNLTDILNSTGGNTASINLKSWGSMGSRKKVYNGPTSFNPNTNNDLTWMPSYGSNFNSSPSYFAVFYDGVGRGTHLDGANSNYYRYNVGNNIYNKSIPAINNPGQISAYKINQSNINDYINIWTYRDQFYGIFEDATLSVVYDDYQDKLADGQVRFKISVNHYVKDGIEYNNIITFDGFYLTGFLSDPNKYVTRLKVSQISALDNGVNSYLYDLIFGVNDKGFTIDWEKNLSSKQSMLIRGINDHVSDFFINPSYTKVSSASISLNSLNNKAIANLTFSGLDEHKQQVNNLTGTITIDLKPTPSSNGTDSNPSTNPIANYQKYLQHWIDQNHRFPNDNELKQIISSFLNTILDKIPDAWIPNGAIGSFSPSNINVNSSIINLQNPSNILIPSGAISIISPSNVIFPVAHVHVGITKQVLNEIRIDGPYANYYAYQILRDVNKQNQIVEWIKSKKNQIFQNVPSNVNFSNVSFSQDTSNGTNLFVQFNFDNAYGIKGPTILYVSLKITGFNSNTSKLATTLKVTEMSWDDKGNNGDLFNLIFGSNDKGFASDWKNSLNQKSQILKDKMNKNIDRFFNNPNNTSVSNVNMTLQDTIARAEITYSGLNDKGILSNTLKGTINILLRKDPSSDGSDTNPDTNPIVNYGQALQKWIDQNHRFPNDNELKQIVSDYLNSIKQDLPNSWIPASGSFSPNDIKVNTSNINFSNPSSITVPKDAISVTKPKTIIFPQTTVHVNVTKQVLNEIRIDGSYANYYVYEILSDNTKQNKIIEWIKSKTNQIFKDIPNPVNFSNYSFSQDPNNGTNLIVKFNFNNAYGVKGPVVLHVTLTITGFNSNTSNVATNLKVHEMSWDDNGVNGNLFNQVFGSNDKGFVADWKNSLNQKSQILKDKMNQSINTFFNNPNNTSVSNVNMTLQDTTVHAKITYSGLNDKGIISNNLSGTINILLRKDPSSDGSDTNPDTNPVVNYGDALQQWIDKNHRFPSDNELKKIISDYLNSIKNNLPDSWIPSSGSFSPNDVNVDTSKIDFSNPSKITIPKDAISVTNPKTIIFPQTTVHVNVTKQIASSISADGNIKNYLVVDILNDRSKQQDVTNWIQSNISYIFKPVNNDMRIVNAKYKADPTNGSTLIVDFELANAYGVKGLVNLPATLKITNFNSDTSNIATTLKVTEMSWDENGVNGNLFKLIFGPDEKGFAVDWKNDVASKEKILKDGINAHINDFFNNPNNTLVSSVNIAVDTNTNIATATILFSGLNDQGLIQNDLLGDINILLRPAPPIDGGDWNPETNILAKFRQYLQDYVTAHHVFPDDSTLQQLACDFLNQNIKDIPNTWIPNGTNFVVSDITVNGQKVIKADGDPNVDLLLGAIKINNNILFPHIDNIIVNITSLKNPKVAIDGELSNLPAIDFVYGDNASANQEKLLVWINANLSNIFNNVDSQMMFETINIEYLGAENSLLVNGDLLNAYDTTQRHAVHFEFTIYGFNNSGQENATSLKITYMNYYDQIFKDTFNDKGFVIDWQTSILEKQELLKQKLIQEKNIFFYNANYSFFEVVDVEMTFGNSDTGAQDTKVTTSITYRGMRDDNTIGLITSYLYINLRENPYEYLNFREPVQNWIDMNHKIPDDNELKEIIANYLNVIKNDLPNAWVPKSASGSDNNYNVNNIIFNPNGIDRTEDTISTNPDGIWIDVGNGIIIKDIPIFSAQYIPVSIPQTPWEKWVKYVVISAAIFLVIVLFITLIVYIYKRHHKTSY